MAFVRADLGQIEPRVLAVVSGDPALAAATSQDDMYAPVAAHLDVNRATAKTAMLGAMYGATTARGAQALRRLKAACPVAMAYLDGAARQAQAGQDLRTYGGRLIPMRSGTRPDATTPEPSGAVAARGRYGRNALIQGAAAELFKMWAVTVRARIAALDAHVVLCLHDELLIHTPQQGAATVAKLTASALNEEVQRWAPATPVRFLAEIALLQRWSDAKNPQP
jgi:DNA polymerase-1